MLSRFLILLLLVLPVWMAAQPLASDEFWNLIDDPLNDAVACAPEKVNLLGVWKSSDFSRLPVFPNPTPGPLVVQTEPLDAEVSLTLCGLDGRPVRQIGSYRRLGSPPLDLSDLPAGFYVLEVRSSKGVQRVRVEKLPQQSEVRSPKSTAGSQPSDVDSMMPDEG